MGFVEDSIRKVWVGTNVSANIVGASSACSSHKWSFSAVVIRLASTHRDGRGAVASEDEKIKLVALYTHHGHTPAHSRRTRTDRGVREISCNDFSSSILNNTQHASRPPFHTKTRR